MDNDQESNDNIIEREIKKGYEMLVQEITIKKIIELEETIGF